MKKSLIGIAFATGFAVVAPSAFAYESPADDPYWKRATPATVSAIGTSAQAAANCTAIPGHYHQADDYNA